MTEYERKVCMRILGIDPGYALLGYGVIDTDGRSATAVDYGVVETKSGSPFPERLQRLYDVRAVRDVPPGCFLPRPEVTSVVLSLRLHGRHPLDRAAAERFRALVKEARIRFISGRPRKRTVDDRQMALPGF